MKNGYFNQQNLRLSNAKQQRSKSDVRPCSEQANNNADEPIWKICLLDPRSNRNPREGENVRKIFETT